MSGGISPGTPANLQRLIELWDRIDVLVAEGRDVATAASQAWLEREQVEIEVAREAALEEIRELGT